MSGWLDSLCRGMPKAELHMHLDGAVSPETALALDPAAFAPPTYQNAHQRLVVQKPLASQRQLLAYYDLPVRLLQSEEALERVTCEMLRNKAADNVRYCEVRWAPALHTGAGLTVGGVVESVLRGKERARRAFGIHATLIAVALRGWPVEENLAMLRAVAPYVAPDKIVAVDCAGVEEEAPDPTPQLPFFEAARRLGLHVTLHCGELPGHHGMIRRAVEAIRPDRLAHGAGAAEDEALCALLRERDIMLDLCPTSNIQAGLYPDHARYPLATLLRRGVLVSISTDSPCLSGVALSGEYARTARGCGLTAAQLWRVNRMALCHSFAPAALRERLLAEFDGWARPMTELHD